MITGERRCGASSQASDAALAYEGGYLPAPVTIAELLIAPGERAGLLVDFSALAGGTKVILMNSARTPFPKGAPPGPQTTGQIMQFTVVQAPLLQGGKGELERPREEGGSVAAMACVMELALPEQSLSSMISILAISLLPSPLALGHDSRLNQQDQ